MVEQKFLRIAAKSLIEWRTPIYSTLYKKVFFDFLSRHPLAAIWKIKKNKKLQEIDEEKIILWYLSEKSHLIGVSKGKLLSENPEYFSTHDVEVGQKRIYDFLHYFIDYSSNPNNEYLSPMLMDGIRLSISGGQRLNWFMKKESNWGKEREELQAMAFDLLHMIFFDDSKRDFNSLAKKLINQLIRSIPVFSRIRTMQRFFHARNVGILFVVLLYLLGVPLIQNFNTMQPEFFFWILAIMLTLLTISIRYKNAVREFIRGYRVSLYEQAKKSTIGFSSVEGRMLLLAYNYQISHDWFISKLKYKCLADPVFFSDLLKRGYKNHWHWIEPILSATDSAPSVVIKEALKLVPNIEISDRQKRFLVKWLGNVQITD